MIQPNPLFRCERCGKNRWRTVIKKVAWVCRSCGHTRPDYDTLGAMPVVQ